MKGIFVIVQLLLLLLGLVGPVTALRCHTDTDIIFDITMVGGDCPFKCIKSMEHDGMVKHCGNCFASMEGLCWECDDRDYCNGASPIGGFCLWLLLIGVAMLPVLLVQQYNELNNMFSF